MRRRRHDADTMLKAVDLAMEYRSKVPLGQPIPGVMVPKTTGSSAAAKEPEVPEVLKAHCLNCHRAGRAAAGQSTFAVEGEQKMPTGAIRVHGTCTHPDCKGKVSTFVSAASRQKAAA